MNHIRLFIILFSISFLGCNDNNVEIEYPNNDTIGYNYYFQETQKLNALAIDAVLVLKNTSNRNLLENEKLVLDEIFSQVNKDYDGSFGSIDLKTYGGIMETPPNKLTYANSKLSLKTLNYFNELEKLNYIGDYKGMVNLLYRYKLEYNTDSTLESLSSVFSIIELYESDLLGETVSKCKISGKIRWKCSNFRSC